MEREVFSAGILAIPDMFALAGAGRATVPLLPLRAPPSFSVLPGYEGFDSRARQGEHRRAQLGVH